jgi:hypothetical protein
MRDIKYANFAWAERWAAPEPAPASRETRFALWPSMPAQAGMEPRPPFSSGDRRTYSFGEGLS